MPKLKSHSGASKRFKKTANGVKRRGAYRNHILTKKKSSKQKRQLRVNSRRLFSADEKAVLRMLRGG